MEKVDENRLLSVPLFLFSSLTIAGFLPWFRAQMGATTTTDAKAKKSPNTINHVELVKTTCQEIVHVSKSVFIDASAIIKAAEELVDADLESSVSKVNWNEGGWHYCEDASTSGPKTCQYIFVLDALNFCFWPVQDLEYDYLASALKEAFIKDERIFEADFLKNIHEETLQSWFPRFKLPLLNARVNRLREIGAVLSEKYDDLACNVVLSAENDAVALVRIIIENFPGFRDAYVHPKSGEYVHFYKRAQILVGDIWAAYGRPEEGHQYYLSNMEELTTFADYRVPQLLRNMGILKYNVELENLVDNCELIECGSAVEMEIRASTIIAVDMLHKILLSRGFQILVIELDWLLWQRAEQMKDCIKPHHRTLTIFY